MLRNCQHFTSAIMAPVEILVKLMSAFMYRRSVGLVSSLTAQPGRAAAAITSALPGCAAPAHHKYNACLELLTIQL